MFYDSTTNTAQYASFLNGAVYRLIDRASRDEHFLPEVHELQVADATTECTATSLDDDFRVSAVRGGGQQYRFRGEW